MNNYDEQDQAFQGQGEDVVYGLGDHGSDFGDLMRGEKDLNPQEPAIEGNRGSGAPTLGDQGNSETPRERLPGSGGSVQSAPPQSSQPRPAQSAMNVNRGEGEAQADGVIPFQPMPGVGQSIGKRGAAGSRLFGALGGLQGGGIGVPHAVGYNETGQQGIGELMQMLTKKRGLF